MSKFGNLIKYLPHLDENKFGTWVVDCENDGTPEHPIQIPFVNYSEMAHHFIDDVYVYDFSDNSSDFALTHYGDILKQNGLDVYWSPMNNDHSRKPRMCRKYKYTV